MENYFLTAGKGLVLHAISELKWRLGESNLNVLDILEGKVVFDVPNAFNDILCNCKTVERVFYRLVYCPSVTFREKADQFTLANLISNINNWEHTMGLVMSFSSKDNAKNQPKDAKRRKILYDGVRKSFRVNCKCPPWMNKHLTSKQLVKLVATLIKNNTNWVVDLHEPTVEIVVHINHEGTLIGVPLFKQPLAERSYIKHSGLRSTVAYLMASFAQIAIGDIVLDPLCGNGILLVEAAKQWKHAMYVGSDLSEKAVQNCLENIEFAKEADKIHLLPADARTHLLKAKSVDKIVCDLPFGHNHGTCEEIQLLYPQILRNFNRLLRQNGLAVLLTDIKHQQFLIDIACGGMNTCLCNTDPADIVKERNVNDIKIYENLDYTPNCDMTCLPQSCDNHQLEITTQSLHKQCTNSPIKISPFDVEIQKQTNVNPEKINYMRCCCERFNWILISEHKLKLGELWAIICVFKKV